MSLLIDIIIFTVLIYLIARSLVETVYGTILIVIGLSLTTLGYTLSLALWIYQRIKMSMPGYKRRHFLYYLPISRRSSRH